MKKLKVLVSVFLIFIGFLAFETSIAGHCLATLTSLDSTYGSNSITFDSMTGLEWLDVTQSTNLSYNYVVGQLGSGGQFEGFRYATRAEVFTLCLDAGITDISGAWSSSSYQPMVALQELVGITWGAFNSTFGVTADQFSTLIQYGVALQAQNNPNSSVFQEASVIIFYPESDSPIGMFGNWLVRESVPIPEPSIILLLGLGLVGLAGVRRKFKK